MTGPEWKGKSMNIEHRTLSSERRTHGGSLAAFGVQRSMPGACPEPCRRVRCSAFWLTILLGALAGCQSGAPPGYEQVKKVVDPKNRAVAIIPFKGSKNSSFTLIEGIKLAEMVAIDLQKALPKLRVIGPRAMQDALLREPDESRWHEIGAEVGAKLLVVGEVTFISTQYDKLLQSKEGTIGIEFRILDVSVFAPRRLARVNWRLGFPEEAGGKFGPEYVTMDEASFRNELIKFAARKIAGVFYDHLEKRRPVSQLQVDWRVE